MRESLDRLSPALVSSDLSMTARRGDADFVAALGFASRTYPIASPMIRMYLARDPKAVHEARQAASDMARIAARRQGVLLRAREVVEIGRQALEYVMDRTCPRCHGTKYEVVNGTGRLGTEPCKCCHGDGRKQIPRRYRKLVTEVISRIERIEGTLDSIVAHRV